VPGYNIKRRMIKIVLKKFASELAYCCKIARNVLVPTVWSLKMHRACQSISADWSQIWKHEMWLVRLTYKSSSFHWVIFFNLFIFGVQIDLEFYSSLDNANLKRLNYHPSKLSGNIQNTFLWHYQHVAIGWVKAGFTHILIASISMDTKTIFHWRITGATHGFYTLNKINFLSVFRIHNRFPSKLRRIHMKSWIRIGGEVADKVLLSS